jgi:hypothetical protein
VATRWPIGSELVTVYAQRLADTDAVMAAVSRLGTGDTFCATIPDDGDGDGDGDAADGPTAYSATISDTIATFVIEVAQDPLFGELPAALASSGWSAAELTGYDVSVPALGPGSERLRYWLAKALLEVTGGVLVGTDGARIEVDSLADATWGSLW